MSYGFYIYEPRMQPAHSQLSLGSTLQKVVSDSSGMNYSKFPSIWFRGHLRKTNNEPAKQLKVLARNWFDTLIWTWSSAMVFYPLVRVTRILYVCLSLKHSYLHFLPSDFLPWLSVHRPVTINLRCCSWSIILCRDCTRLLKHRKGKKPHYSFAWAINISLAYICRDCRQQLLTARGRAPQGYGAVIGSIIDFNSTNSGTARNS